MILKKFMCCCSREEFRAGDCTYKKKAYPFSLQMQGETFLLRSVL